LPSGSLKKTKPAFERVSMAAGAQAIGVVQLDLADLDAALDQLGARRPQVGDHQLETFE
jgi:hypothetical protein